jgi:Tol biopolymer transport system component
MTAFDRFDRLPAELPDLLTDLAAPRIPDYVDDVLAVTAATRQRPRWTFSERWLPMGVIATERVSVPPFSWRTLALVVLLIAALVGGALLIVGSRRHVLAPFGPARNGALLFGRDGDIRVREVDGTSRLLVGGPTDDFAAGYTRDGTRLTYLRRTAGSPGSADEQLVMVSANADGSNPIVLTRPLISPDWSDLSPDDSMAVVAEGDYAVGQHLYTFPVRQAGDLKPIDVGDRNMFMNVPNFLGPDGKEIVFRGGTIVAAGQRSGLFAVHPDGSGLRPLTPTDGDPSNDYQWPQVSPDGRYVAYSRWDGTFTTIHLVDLRTGSDRALDPGFGTDEGYATFSPDSTQMLYTDFRSIGNQLVLRRVDGTGAALDIGPLFPRVDGLDLSAIWAPDGQSIMVVDGGSKLTRLVDTSTGGVGRLMSWSPGDVSGWQRLAP